MRSLLSAIAAGVALSLSAYAVLPGGAAEAATVRATRDAQKVCALPASAAASPGTARAAQEGLDQRRLVRAVTALSLRSRISVEVFRNNCLVATNALFPLTRSIHNDLWSVTKSVVSMLTGIAAGAGDLRLDDPIGRYLPAGPGWGDAAHRAITIRELLTQTSGMSQAILSEAASAGLDPSLAQEALAQPLVHPPGTVFQYFQLGPALLGYVVQRAVGQDLIQYAQQHLFGPIGIKQGSYFWLRDRSGQAYGYAHLFLTPPQLARLALLMSNGGRWNGASIIPSSYVAQAGLPTPTNGCYGLLFWSNGGVPCTGADIPTAQTFQRHAFPPLPADAYEMNGTGGQLAVMIPSLRMTVVTTGYFGSMALDPPVALGASPDEMQWTFFRALMKAVKDVHVPDPGPYRDEMDLDLNPMNYLDPSVLLTDLVTNPTCNVVVCDGKVPTQGLLEDLQSLPGLL